ncbi:hypothetical protein Tco_0656446 [Tanacetum coccineum]|uniref:Uncharacterized protein n=1 Tax=Tanacetum coccineum TaxID=301880 RepID=A0ABQ4XA28_9ASTR
MERDCQHGLYKAGMGSSRVLSDFAEKYGSKNRVLAGFGIGGKSGKEKSSAKKSLGDQEDASKQGRNEIDQDEGILWFQEDSETQGRYGHDIGVNTASTSITTAKPVTTASALITTVDV